MTKTRLEAFSDAVIAIVITITVLEFQSGPVLWANMHLLFWLSLVPFTTAWTGDSRLAPLPTAVYGVVLLLAAVGYWILVNTIIAREGPESRLRAAVGKDVKGKVSILIYALAVLLAFVNPWIAGALYVSVVSFLLSLFVASNRQDRDDRRS